MNSLRLTASQLQLNVSQTALLGKTMNLAEPEVSRTLSLTLILITSHLLTCHSQSQSYFTTGDLQPISLFWRQSS
jgi:hypothetical protein